jgi:N-acetylglutamate synthase-like GNAT family acetyltransferase
MKMEPETCAARLATIADLAFVSQDGILPQAMVARKVAQEECFLVELNDRPVGVLRLEYLWSLVPYIALIHIKEGHRKHGCSRVLLDFVIEFLREKGHHRLYSSSQADEPTPQAWHRHMGFEECGVICEINQGGIDEIFFLISF